MSYNKIRTLRAVYAYSSVMFVSPAFAAGCSAETPGHAKKVTTNVRSHVDAINLHSSEARLGATKAACVKPSAMAHQYTLVSHKTTFDLKGDL